MKLIKLNVRVGHLATVFATFGLSAACSVLASTGGGGSTNPCVDPGTPPSSDHVWEADPDCEYAKYTVSIGSPVDDETYEKGSGQTGSATAGREGENSGFTDRTGDIIWSGDASGNGGTSSDFTASLGAKTLTASANGESDSVSVHVAELESLEAEDTSTSAGTRMGDSLVMVYSDTDRAATITATYVSSSSYGSAYPSWSGNGLQSPSDGDLSVNYSSGANSYPDADVSSPDVITVTYANGATETISIEVVDETSFNVQVKSDDQWAKEMKDGINSIVEAITGDPDDFLSVSGQVSLNGKYVDLYNDASDYGNYLEGSGSISASFGQFSAESPNVPTPISGVTVKAAFAFDALQVGVGVTGVVDESTASGGSFSGSITGSSGMSLTITVQAGVDKLCVQANGTVSSSIAVAGDITYTDPDIDLTINVSASELKVEIDFVAKLGPFECTLYSKEYEYGASYDEDFGPYNLYSFD